MSVRRNCVIREVAAATEVPRNCKLSRLGGSMTQFSKGRFLVVCATRNDSRSGEAGCHAI